MRPLKVTATAAGASEVVPVNWRSDDFKLGIAVVISGTLTCSVQVTMTDDLSTATSDDWFDHDTLSVMTSSDIGNVVVPITGVRLNVTSFTSGSAKMNIVSSGG